MLSSNRSADEIENAQKQYRDIYGDSHIKCLCTPERDFSENDFFGVLLGGNIKRQDICFDQRNFLAWKTKTGSR